MDILVKTPALIETLKLIVLIGEQEPPQIAFINDAYVIVRNITFKQLQTLEASRLDWEYSKQD